MEKSQKLYGIRALKGPMKIEVCKLSEDDRKTRNIPLEPAEVYGWSVWECEPSRFNWHYEERERAYLYKGRVRIKTNAETVEIKAGDFVTFPEGLSCQWDVLEKVVKVYRFK